MNCADLQTDVLVDLVDGRLDGAEQRGVERHLDACAQCRALVEDLRSIRAAAFMLDRHEPKAATWASLQAAIAAEPAPKRRVLDMAWRDLSAVALAEVDALTGVRCGLARPRR